MYLQTKKKNKFVKIPKFFYIEILYCLLWSLGFALLCRQNLGEKILGPLLDQILDPLLITVLKDKATTFSRNITTQNNSSAKKEETLTDLTFEMCKNINPSGCF